MVKDNRLEGNTEYTAKKDVDNKNLQYDEELTWIFIGSI